MQNVLQRGMPLHERRMIYVDMVAITDKRCPLGMQKEEKAEI